jgi:hypothetical protein
VDVDRPEGNSSKSHVLFFVNGTLGLAIQREQQGKRSHSPYDDFSLQLYMGKRMATATILRRRVKLAVTTPSKSRTGGIGQIRPAFSDEQQRELLKLGMYFEQILRLQVTLSSVAWRCAPTVRMQDVREKLTDFAKALRRVETLYVRMSTSRNFGNAEAAARLNLAEDETAQLRGRHRQPGEDILHDSLETASDIASYALKNLPRTRRSTRRNSAEFIGLIVNALQGGHGEHFVNQGEPMPGFTIEVSRKKAPFPDIVRITSEASGGWSSDDAIRAYLKQGAPENHDNLRRRKR